MVIGAAGGVAARARTSATPRFPLTTSGLALKRGLTSGAFFDVVGRRSGAFGYEERPFEVWVYPLKILDDLAASVPARGISARDARA